MEAETTRKLREPVEIEYEDGRRDKISVKRLSNTDMIKWIDLGFDKSFLVFRSVELPATDPSSSTGQKWFDSLTQESAFTVVEKALELNQSPIQKKMVAAAMANIQSWLSAMPSSSSSPAATTSKT